MNKRRNAFTLVEILVVLAIIAILAALLFPAFGRARESARQTHCASNLQAIGFAVLQYRKDEGRYPDTLVDILGESTKVADAGASGDYKLDGKATGYLKSGQDTLVCPDDDTLPADKAGRSSYGSLSKSSPAPYSPTAADLGQYVWNYWGYRPDGFAYMSPQEAKTNTPVGSPLLSAPQDRNGVNQGFLYPSLGDTSTNLIKYSMSNRFAPVTTIITHCIYHRLQTANNLNGPADMYGPAPLDSANAKDVVLRLDGSAKAVDVSQWNPADPASNFWQRQTTP